MSDFQPSQSEIIHLNPYIQQAIHLEKAKNVTVSEATGLMHKLQNTYDELQNQTNLALVRNR